MLKEHIIPYIHAGIAMGAFFFLLRFYTQKSIKNAVNCYKFIIFAFVFTQRKGIYRAQVRHLWLSCVCQVRKALITLLSATIRKNEENNQILKVCEYG